MVSKTQTYKRKLDVADRFLRKKGISEDVRNLAYSIMDGSYRNGAGKGSRTYGTQRVDTYKGRIEAITTIFGLNSSEEFGLLEKVISSNNYLANTQDKKTGLTRADSIVNYIQELAGEKRVIGAKYVPQIKILEKEKSLGYQEALHQSIEGRNHRFFKKLALGGLAASLLIGGFSQGLMGCSRDKKDSIIKSENSGTANLVSQASSHFSTSTLYPRLASPKDSLCYRGVKKSSSDLDGGITPEQLRKFYDDNPNAMPDYSIKEENVVPMPKLGKVVKVGRVEWHEIPEEQRTAYVEKKSEIVETNKIVDAQIKPVGTNGLYRKQVDARNSQTRDLNGDGLDEKVSASPVYFGKAVGNEFERFGKEVVDGKDLGYGNGKTKARLKNLGEAFSLGFTKENRESRKNDNFLLRTIRAVYDGAQELVEGVVATPDLVLGGLTEKVVYDVVGEGARTLVNSTVDAGNFVFAVPADASQRFENWAFKNKGKVSMEVYEAASTLMRFGGNVVLHEAPFDGRYVEVLNENGEKIIINKGETGATLESIVAVLLDAGVLSSHKSGGSGNGGNSGNGGVSGGFSSTGSPGGI